MLRGIRVASLVGIFFLLAVTSQAQVMMTNITAATLAMGGATAASTYTASIETDIVQPPATPNMGGLTKNNAVFTDTSYSSGTPVQMIRCTDANTNPSPNGSFSAGLGGSGDATQLFNANDTILHINANVGQLILFDPATETCGDPVTGYAITADKDLTNPGSSSVGFNFGSGSFDWSNPNLYYGTPFVAGGTGTQIEPYTISISNGTFTEGALLADFQYGLPYGSNVSAWLPSHNYLAGTYVTYTLTSGQAPDWQALHSYSNLGDIILPLTHNPLGCAFKLVTAGTSTSAGSEPTWSSGSYCAAASNQVYGDGTAGWRSLGGPPTFLFQLTTRVGNTGSSTPAFVPVSTGHPDIMTTVGDNGNTWTNSGVEQLAAPWVDFAGVSFDGTRFCEAVSTNSYGYNGNYTLWNDDQGTAIFMQCYSTITNQYVLLNTGTGWQSSTTCSGGTGYNCSGGTLTLGPVGAVAVLAGNCGFFIHNDKGSYTNDYPVVAVQSTMGATGIGCSYGGSPYVWNPFLTFNSTTNLQPYVSGNHWSATNTHFVNIGQDGNTGYTTGIYAEVTSALTPSTEMVSWQPPCALSWSPGNALPPCQFALGYDSHLSPAFNPGGLDITPVCGTIYNYATLAPPPVAPWQGEWICVPTSPTWVIGGTPSGQNAPWRFTHEFNSGGSPNFSAQFGIGQLSGDGRWGAFTTDLWNDATNTCGLGSSSGGGTSLCGKPWVGGTVYATGTMLNPFSSTGGSGTNYGVWKVTTPGTAAATHPAWVVCNSGNVGTTVTDSNGVVYTCQGSNNSRADVMIVKMR